MPRPKRYESAAARQRAYRQRLEAKFGASVCTGPTPKASAIPSIPSAARWRAMREHAAGLLAALHTEMETTGTTAPRNGRKASEAKSSRRSSTSCKRLSKPWTTSTELSPGTTGPTRRRREPRQKGPWGAKTSCADFGGVPVAPLPTPLQNPGSSMRLDRC